MVLGVDRRHGGAGFWYTGTMDEDEDYGGTKEREGGDVRPRRQAHEDVSNWLGLLGGNDIPKLITI